MIQLAVPSGWANFHLPWAALAVVIMALGPGALSLDQLVERWFYSPSPVQAAGRTSTGETRE